MPKLSLQLLDGLPLNVEQTFILFISEIIFGLYLVYLHPVLIKEINIELYQFCRSRLSSHTDLDCDLCLFFFFFGSSVIVCAIEHLMCVGHNVNTKYLE